MTATDALIRALSITFPEDYSTGTGSLTGSINATTNENGDETATFALTIQPEEDLVLTLPATPVTLPFRRHVRRALASVRSPEEYLAVLGSAKPTEAQRAAAEARSTAFRARPGETLRRRAGQVARRLLPPVIYDLRDALR